MLQKWHKNSHSRMVLNRINQEMSQRRRNQLNRNHIQNNVFVKCVLAGKFFVFFYLNCIEYQINFFIWVESLKTFKLIYWEKEKILKIHFLLKIFKKIINKFFWWLIKINFLINADKNCCFFRLCMTFCETTNRWFYKHSYTGAYNERVIKIQPFKYKKMSVFCNNY